VTFIAFCDILIYLYWHIIKTLFPAERGIYQRSGVSI